MPSVSEPSPAVSSTLILASASPRRRDLMTQLAIPFAVMPANIDERQGCHEEPQAYAMRVAEAKAWYLAQQFPEALVLGADTIVVLGTQILGKPGSAQSARQTLSQLSGRQHTVITALAVVQSSRPFARCDTVQTRVRFRPLDPVEIERYVATQEPFDKAGAYAIQGGAASFVASLEGCYTNVMGLPLQRTAALLREAGLHVPILPRRNGKNAS